MTRFIRFALTLSMALLATACITNRSVGGSFDDTGADLTLKRILLTDTSHDYSDIDITIFEGRMMLTGTVKTMEARQALANQAARITTVSEVLNEVIIAPRTTMTQGANDVIIDEKLGAALRADNGVFRGNFQIAVSQGNVYLLGVAQNATELDRVTSHAQTIKGVKNVVSHVVFVGDPRRN
ncbi:MAG: BON domain-containing protein [Pseudomonadota bacterium]